MDVATKHLGIILLEIRYGQLLAQSGITAYHYPTLRDVDMVGHKLVGYDVSKCIVGTMYTCRGSSST